MLTISNDLCISHRNYSNQLHQIAYPPPSYVSSYTDLRVLRSSTTHIYLRRSVRPAPDSNTYLLTIPRYEQALPPRLGHTFAHRRLATTQGRLLRGTGALPHGTGHLPPYQCATNTPKPRLTDTNPTYAISRRIGGAHSGATAGQTISSSGPTAIESTPQRAHINQYNTITTQLGTTLTPHHPQPQHERNTQMLTKTSQTPPFRRNDPNNTTNHISGDPTTAPTWGNKSYTTDGRHPREHPHTIRTEPLDPPSSTRSKLGKRPAHAQDTSRLHHGE